MDQSHPTRASTTDLPPFVAGTPNGACSVLCLAFLINSQVQTFMEPLKSPDVGALYTHFGDRLRVLIRAKCSANLAKQFDPEDVLQATFLAFCQGRYEVDANSWKLLRAIALNVIRTWCVHFRASKRDMRRTQSLQAIDVSQIDSSSLHKIIAEETVGLLPKTQREIVDLRLAGYEVSEIAARLGKSKRTVERTLEACRSRLCRQ